VEYLRVRVVNCSLVHEIFGRSDFMSILEEAAPAQRKEKEDETLKKRVVTLLFSGGHSSMAVQP